jgi:hypothetical protein
MEGKGKQQSKQGSMTHIKKRTMACGDVRVATRILDMNHADQELDMSLMGRRKANRLA